MDEMEWQLQSRQTKPKERKQERKKERKKEREGGRERGREERGKRARTELNRELNLNRAPALRESHPIVEANVEVVGAVILGATVVVVAALLLVLHPLRFAPLGPSVLEPNLNQSNSTISTRLLLPPSLPPPPSPFPTPPPPTTSTTAATTKETQQQQPSQRDSTFIQPTFMISLEQLRHLLIGLFNSA